ncbi:MAG: HAD-IA family hydrolase [Granulosicoccaceae bacterium]|jgi:phosphoglycolate phosphatase
MPSFAPHLRTVLFDLDGTLLDTAPDLAEALNFVRLKHGLDALSHDIIRPHVSHGAAALIKFGFSLDEQAPEYASLYQELLDYYAQNLACHTRPFPGIHEVLQTIEGAGLNWGVVTNKPERFTLPLLAELGLAERAACIICGDTLEQKKPHPEPLLYACKQAGSHYRECVYIGDAQRDIEAGHNAGMHTLVAMFGYLGEYDRPEQWGAEGLVHAVADIIPALEHLVKPA